MYHQLRLVEPYAWWNPTSGGTLRLVHRVQHDSAHVLSLTTVSQLVVYAADVQRAS